MSSNLAANSHRTNANQADRFRRHSRVRLSSQSKDRSPSVRKNTEEGRGRLNTLNVDAASLRSTASSYLPEELHDPEDELDELDEAAKQDIEEVWFPGCHADLGGGWPLADGEESPLSHAPLVWMVREAQRAGLEFDMEQMLELRCCDDTYDNEEFTGGLGGPTPPQIQVTRTESDHNIFSSPKSDKQGPGWAEGMEPEPPTLSSFHQKLAKSATHGILHDCLEFNNGLPGGSVISWKIMEYLPFRRMDLQPDGSWKAISLPLPMGEVRDIPEDAWIHHSAIRRMEIDPSYRPGNLIVGGGGRGMRKAPEEMGLGKWEVLKGDNDPVGMVYVRKGESMNHKIDRKHENGDMKV